MTEANQRVSVTEAYNDSCVIQQIRGLKDSKQDKLTAGTNITISSENVISAADAAAVWGSITGDIEDQDDLQEALEDARIKPEYVEDIAVGYTAQELAEELSDMKVGDRIFASSVVFNGGTVTATVYYPEMILMEKGTGVMYLSMKGKCVSNNVNYSAEELILRTSLNIFEMKAYAASDLTVTSFSSGLRDIDFSSGFYKLKY